MERLSEKLLHYIQSVVWLVEKKIILWLENLIESLQYWTQIHIYGSQNSFKQLWKCAHQMKQSEVASATALIANRRVIQLWLVCAL